MSGLPSSPVAPDGPWTLGVWVWTPVCVLLVLALAAFAAYLWWARSDADDFDRGTLTGLSIGSGVLSLAFVVGTLIGFYPYNSEFHQWRPVSGQVEQVSSRMIAEGKAMSQRYVVVIDGEPFGIDDTRASLLKRGDTVNLSCKREYQYAAQSGWACRWSEENR